MSEEKRITDPYPMEALVEQLPAIQETLLHSDNPEEKHSTLGVLQTILRSPNADDAATLLIQMPLLDYILGEVRTPNWEDLDRLSIMAEIVSNMASTNTNNTAFLVSQGAITIMVNLLRHINDKVPKGTGGVYRTRVIESSIWSLGNIAGDGISHRDAVNESNAHEVILKLVGANPESLSVIRIAIWAMSNFPRGGRFPKKLLTLAHFALKLLRLKDKECHVDALWLLSYLSDGPDTNQIYISEIQGVAPVLISYLEPSTAVELLTPALRAAGNILTGPDSTTSTLIDAGIIPALIPLLKHTRSGVRKESCWAFSNILGGIRSQITACFNSNVHIHLINLIYQNYAPDDVSKEACWGIGNAIIEASREDFVRLVSAPQFIHVYAECLNHTDPGLVQLCMSGLDKVLAYGNVLGRVMAANFDSLIPSEIAPANPFLDFLYAHCPDVLDNDGESSSFEVEKLASAFQVVGNGYHTEVTFEE